MDGLKRQDFRQDVRSCTASLLGSERVLNGLFRFWRQRLIATGHDFLGCGQGTLQFLHFAVESP